MENHPPIWLISLFALQVLLGIALLFLGVSFSGSQVRAADVLGYSIPLASMLGASGLGWWLWVGGNQTLAIAVAVAVPLVVVAWLVLLLAVGI